MIIQGSIRLSFTYAAGRIGSRFLSGLRDSSAILGAHCPRCELVEGELRIMSPTGAAHGYYAIRLAEALARLRKLEAQSGNPTQA